MQRQNPVACQPLPPDLTRRPRMPRLPRSARGRLLLFLGLAALGATACGACRSPSAREAATDALATARAHLPHAQTATLAVRSLPPGATIEIDGRTRGTTPAEVPVGSGHHRVRLRLSGHVAPVYRVRVDAGQTTAIDGELWLETPLVQRLKPPLPGSTIVDAAFLADGRLALVTSQHSSAPGLSAGGTASTERQAWVVDTTTTVTANRGAGDGAPPSPRSTGPLAGALADGTGHPLRIGPPEVRAPLAVSPGGDRVAYLARATPTTPTTPITPPGTATSWGGAPAALTDVWVAPAGGGAGERLFSLPQASPIVGAFGAGPLSGEQLVDLSWSPNGTHLLLVARRGTGGFSAAGAVRTRLLWLNAAAGQANARDVLTIPADVVPGSYSWNPTGDRVGFLARTNTGTALCVLALSDGLVPVSSPAAIDGTFRYLADVSRGGASGAQFLTTATAAPAPSGIAPLAWSPDGRQAVYAAQAPDLSKRASLGGSFGIVGASGPKLTTGLFQAAWGGATGSPPVPAGSVTSVAPATADRRLGTGQAPALRRDGTLVALGPGKRGEPVLRWMNARGLFEDHAPLAPVAARLTSVSAVRWDIAHGQAIVTVAAGGGQLEHWLVRFRTGVGAGTGTGEGAL